MIILHNNNPLNPVRGITVHNMPDGITGNQAFRALGPQKSKAVVLIVDGEAWGRADWDNPFPEGSIVLFNDIQQGLGFIVCAIIAVASAVYAYYMASQISTNSTESGTPDSIYSFSTGANRLRIGEPFAEPIGRLQIYPDLAQQSYVKNIDNDQYLHFLGIIGVGKYDIEGVYIENTPLTDYADSSYNILTPGDSPSLVPNLVWTCNEVSNQELDTDWVTYIVSAAGTEGYYIEYDITFSAGLVGYNDDGGKNTRSVEVQTQVRTVDSVGEALSDWVSLETKTFSAQSKDPLRYSRKIAGPYGAGRYQFRSCRTTAASESSRVMDKAVLSGLRAYGGTHPDYSDVAGLDLTMIECKIKASDQLSGDCGSQINIIGTRKLYPVTASGFSPTLTATRNIADFCAYAVTAKNGGRQDNSIIDFSTLYELRQTWENNGHYFDYKFSDRTSVMEACATAANCGMSVPYMPGGLFSLVRDELQDLPSCVFTRVNISDLTITASPRTEDSQTCVIVTYMNPDTWEEETVICLDVNGSQDNPSEISLDGCTDRQHAYEIGMYIYNQDRLERVSVEFTTGLMGHIPSLLSKILVPNTMISWGQDGIIMDYDSSAGVLWLSEPVDFLGADEGAMYICTADGSSAGPYTVYPTDNDHAVQGTISEALPLSISGLKATRYMFGPATLSPMFVRVSQIQPQGKDKIKITGTLIDDGVYDDPGTTPKIGSITGIPAILESISMAYIGMDGDDYSFVVSWAGSARMVLIELSEDGGSTFSTLEDEYVSHSLAFTSAENDIAVQVTPYDDNDVLDTSYTMTASKVILQAPAGLTITGNNDGIAATWDAYTNATSYNLGIYVDDELMMTTSATTTSASVNATAVAVKGGPWAVFTVTLIANTGDGQSPEASITVEVVYDNSGETVTNNDGEYIYIGG